LRIYRTALLVLSIAFVAIGLALLARTAAEGGGALGFTLGGLFVALGVARLTLALRRT
jgi:hypothetical protein